MPKIPIFRRQRLPSTNVGAAPFTGSTDVAEGAIGQGIAAIGQGVSNLGGSLLKIAQMDLDNKDSLAEMAMKADMATERKIYEQKIIDNGDTATWKGFRDEAISKIKTGNYEWGRGSTQGRAEQIRKGWESNFQEQGLVGEIKKRNVDNISATRSQYVTGLTVGNDSGEAAYRKALGTSFSPKVVDVLVSDAKVDGIKGQIIGLAEVGKYGEARELVNATKAIPPEERVALTNSINYMERSAKNKTKTTNQFIQDSASQELLGQLIEDADAVGQKEFDELPFDEGNEELWAGVLNNRSEELGKGNPDPFLVSDSITNRAISTQLEQDVKDLPDQTEIIKLIGKGITPQEAQDFISTINRRRNKDDVLNKPVVKDVYAYYQDLFEIKAFANLTEEQKERVADGKNPNLTQAQLQDNASDLLIAKRDFNNWLQSQEGSIKSGQTTDNDIEVAGRGVVSGPGSQQEKVTLSLWEKAKLVLPFTSSPPLLAIGLVTAKKRAASKIAAATKSKQIENIVKTTPRSARQLKENIEKLLIIDPAVAEEYLETHRVKFEIQLERLIRE